MKHFWGRGWTVLAALAVSLGFTQGEELRLGFFPNITHGQAVYAKATGDFEKALGVKIKWTAFNAGPTAVESIFTKAIDATYIGPGPTINGYAKSRGQEFVIVAGAASGGAGLVVRKDSNIKTEKDFNGKIIATPQFGNTQDIAARVWFTEQQYRFKDRGGTLTLLPLSNPDQLTMFQKKEIDGAWTVEPWLTRLELEGGGQVFLDEKKLWPDGKYVTTHLIVSRALLKRNPELVKKLVGAHVAVTKKLNEDKTAATKILNDQLKVETGKALKPEVIASALNRVEFTWDPVQTSLFKGAESAHKVGFLKTPPDLNGIYALDILNAVLKEQGLNLTASAGAQK
jgi:NitT/TauT family transport system substrate-binding protein